MIILFMGMGSSLHTQTYLDSTWTDLPIRSIQIHGNKNTRSSLILREMKTQTLDPSDPDKIESDRKRIQSLGLFNRVMIMGQEERDSLDLHIWVTEKWTIIPFPIFHLNERSWKKISYGAGIIHSNLWGLGQTLSVIVKFGYNPVVQFSYDNPWLGGRKNLTMETDIYYQKVRNRHFTDKNVTEEHTGLFLGLGKRLGHHVLLSVSGGYNRIECPETWMTLSTSGTDDLVRLGVTGTWDHRDLKEYPHKGWLMTVSGMKNILPGQSKDYGWITTDCRTYVPLPGGLTWACRYSGLLSSGQIPVYDRVYLGYSERIRGHFFTITEGENIMLCSTALHIPLIPVTYMDLEEQDAMRDLKFGLSFGLFADTGITYFQNQNPWKKIWLTGYGLGLHFHIPYLDVFRIELAFNEKGRSQWIADLFTDL